MKQPTRNKINIENKSKKAVKTKKSPKNKRKHPEYGTSKLEDKFAKEFLDKLGVEYIRQFKAESIGRYFDFYLPNSFILIEIDGDFW